MNEINFYLTQNNELSLFRSDTTGIRTHYWITAFVMNLFVCCCSSLQIIEVSALINDERKIVYLNATSALDWLNKQALTAFQRDTLTQSSNHISAIKTVLEVLQPPLSRGAILPASLSRSTLSGFEIMPHSLALSPAIVPLMTLGSPQAPT